MSDRYRSVIDNPPWKWRNDTLVWVDLKETFNSHPLNPQQIWHRAFGPPGNEQENQNILPWQGRQQLDCWRQLLHTRASCNGPAKPTLPNHTTLQSMPPCPPSGPYFSICISSCKTLWPQEFQNHLDLYRLFIPEWGQKEKQLTPWTLHLRVPIKWRLKNNAIIISTLLQHGSDFWMVNIAETLRRQYNVYIFRYKSESQNHHWHGTQSAIPYFPWGCSFAFVASLSAPIAPNHM